MSLTNQALQADAGISILHSKWADIGVGVTASTSLKRFSPVAKGVFQLKFW